MKANRARGAAVLLLIVIIGAFMAMVTIAFVLGLGTSSIQTGSLMNDLAMENAVLSGLSMGEAAVASGAWQESNGEALFNEVLPWDEESRVTVSLRRHGFWYGVHAYARRGRGTLRRGRLLGSLSAEPLDAALTVSEGDVIIGAGGQVIGAVRSKEQPVLQGGVFTGEWIPMPEGAPHRAINRVEEVFGELRGILEQPPDSIREVFGMIRVEAEMDDTLLGAGAVIAYGPVVLGSRVGDGSWSCSLPRLLICYDDVQIGGQTRIENPCIVVASGMVSIVDRARVGQCILYGDDGCVLTDQARLSGQLISGRDCLVDGLAMAGPGAVLAAAGDMDIAGTAWIRGSVITLTGECHIDADAQVDGAVWSGNSVSLEGLVRGAVVAQRLSNTIQGKIHHRAQDVCISPLLVTGLSEPCIVGDISGFDDMGLGHSDRFLAEAGATGTWGSAR